MASTIKIKNSSTAGAVPTSSDLVQGELAINVTDRRIFTENASGTVVELGTPSIDDNGNATAITIDSSENVGIGTSSPQAHLDISGSSTQFARVSSSTNASFRGYEFGLVGSTQSYGSLAMELNSGEVRLAAGFTGWGGTQTFYTNGTERARIDSSGNLLVGGTTYFGAGLSLGSPESSGCASLFAAGGTGNHFRFGNVNNGIVGGISTSTSATTYSTSSDYRLKENIAPMTGALAVVQQLKPCTYNWKVDGSDGQGFIAHELQAVVPDCVTGEKDAVDSNGNPKYQGIDTSFLVATLTAAIQELKATVDAQAARITALEQA